MTTPLLRAEQVAEILGVSRTTVYNLVAAGQILAVCFRARPGKKKDRLTIRFTEQAVQEFISAHTRKGRQGTAG
jgi:excisionase family DNA binding protein